MPPLFIGQAILFFLWALPMLMGTTGRAIHKGRAFRGFRIFIWADMESAPTKTPPSAHLRSLTWGVFLIAVGLTGYK